MKFNYQSVGVRICVFVYTYNTQNIVYFNVHITLDNYVIDQTHLNCKLQVNHHNKLMCKLKCSSMYVNISLKMC